MKNLVFYAPPSAGKGTQCALLAERYGYTTLSTGQALRNNRNPETEIGRIIIETQDKGILTPDDIVAEALKNELAKLSGKALIIDGYPRNIEQAKLLDSILDDYIVINLYIDRELAMKRTLGRITCSNCGRIFNKYLEGTKPKVENVCDDCGSELDTRTDDNENSFNVRFDVYEENAPSILDYYEQKGILFRVNSGISKEYTNSEIEKILNRD